MDFDFVLNLILILFGYYFFTSTIRRLQGCIVCTLWQGLPIMGSSLEVTYVPVTRLLGLSALGYLSTWIPVTRVIRSWHSELDR